MQSSPNREDAFTLEELATQILRHETRHPISFRTMVREASRRLKSLREGRLESVLVSLVERGVVLKLQDAYFLTSNLELIESRIRDVMRSYHSMYPYRPAMRTGEIRGRISKGKTRNARRNVHPDLFDRALEACKRRGDVLEVDEGLHLRGFFVDPAELQKFSVLQEAILNYIDDRRYQGFKLADLVRDLGEESAKTRILFTGLIDTGEIVKFAENRYLVGEAFERIKSDLIKGLTTAMAEERPGLTTGEIKSLLGIPRNTLIPLLEHLDSTGVTRREGNVRVLGDTIP